MRGNRLWRRAGIALIAVALVQQPGAANAAGVTMATFSGTYTTGCPTLPTEDGAAVSGGYECQHTATSTACAAVVDLDHVAGAVRGCIVALTWGTTEGHADGYGYVVQTWTCTNGAGTGTAVYRPADGSADVTMAVTMRVDGSVIQIDGESTQSGTNRVVTLSATMPAVCSPSSGGSGFQGTVTAL